MPNNFRINQMMPIQGEFVQSTEKCITELIAGAIQAN